MSIHLVQRRKGYDPAVAAAQANDVIVLMGEGVAAVLDGACDCYACGLDIDARGLSDLAGDTITRITDARLVDLCVEHTPCVTWNGT